ncbi:hypothetical protein KOW79_019254 [Hemibagrus wyckioides]|uniref:Uncharacterized protein n=1 Tax=Hemibagrus wyckioides TaxID=337641 RepID=A0A9D3SA23_9TELE|nr:hypothetical protein KOW79_019254 [Hemibagrus wyckioides]
MWTNSPNLITFDLLKDKPIGQIDCYAVSGCMVSWMKGSPTVPSVAHYRNYIPLCPLHGRRIRLLFCKDNVS